MTENIESITTTTSGYLQTDLKVDKPKYLKVGYKKYEIVKKPELIALPNELLGRISYDEEKIELSTKVNQNMQNQSFLHEMVHGIFEKINYHDLRKDERLVDLFASCLYEIILDNPDIFTMQDI